MKLRSKSFLIVQPTFGLKKQHSINLGVIPNGSHATQDLESLKSIKSIASIESIDNINPNQHEKDTEKRPSELVMENVYNFNMAIKSRNATKIQKLILPAIDPGSPHLSQDNGSSLFSLSPLLRNTKRRMSTMSNSSQLSSSPVLKSKKITPFEETFVDTLKRILKKDYHKRTEDDISVLVNTLSQITFFQTLGVQNEQNLIERCCRYVKLEFFQKGEYVFHFGSQGSKFYIIVKGSVGVLVPKFGRNSKSDEFVEVKILKEGASFGEMALITKKTRSASILCKEDCYFAVLDRKYFFEILLDFEEKKLQSAIDFLRLYRIFNNWTPTQLSSVSLATSEKKYMRNHMVFQQGDITNELYLIKSGEFEYIKEVTYFDGERYEEYPYIPDVLKENFALRRSKKFEISVARFGVGSLLGAEGVFMNKPAEHTLISTRNDGVIVVLPKMELFQRCSVENFKSMMKLIQDDSMNKNQKFQKKMEDFLKCFHTERTSDKFQAKKTLPNFAKTFKTEDPPEIKISLSPKQKDEELGQLTSPRPSFPSLNLLKKRASASMNGSQLEGFLKGVKPPENSKNLSPKEQSLNLTNGGEYAHNDTLRSTIRNLNVCRSFKGLSKKRSSTLLMKLINDYEKIEDLNKKKKTEKEKSIEFNYSLTKRENNDFATPRLNDPYGIITILNPKFRKEIEETSERVKLLRKKLT